MYHKVVIIGEHTMIDKGEKNLGDIKKILEEKEE
jgi:hypothetical protein